MGASGGATDAKPPTEPLLRLATRADAASAVAGLVLLAGALPLALGPTPEAPTVIAGNLRIIAPYVVTRTVGIPALPRGLSRT